MSFTKLITTFLSTYFFLTANLSFCQKKIESVFNKEISISIDNDVFALTGTDRYYTSGLQMMYSKAAKTLKPGKSKQLNQWEIRQMIFTPYKRQILAATEIDRPITGHLQAKFTRSTFTTKNHLVQWGLALGVTGKSSLARQVLDNFHPFFKINSEWWGWMWEYQLKDEVGINAHGTFAFPVIGKNTNSLFQVTPVTNIEAGTSFSNVKQSFLFQFGRFNKMHQGSYWNARIENAQSSVSNKSEIFFMYQPELMYQLYDATIQGGMFITDKGRITWPVQPFVFTHQVAFYFSTKRYSLSLHEFFQTRQAKYQFNNHAFGRLKFGYRFG